ncbi:helix-turn-helix transcriptional regulator [Streptomyces sp. NRRL WC-3742]|uniref:helix-turn-helix transcriptional regulator n=1 Tax=Streptomyces sp. NRRL WC-3742 TaxID=1463934 RepID=UPI0005609E3C|nr:helix-turn-helix transcriptional regulator [Streptomyces sp. NRRL WC-3742]
MKATRPHLARRRKALGCSQDGFAEALDVDRSTVSRWERGDSEPQPHIRPRLARLLKLSVVELDGLLELHPTGAAPATCEPQIAIIAPTGSAVSRAPTETQRRRLCETTADLLQLAGEIFFDGNRYTDAAQCYALAVSAAREASAYDLWACALARHAFIGLYERRFATTVPMLKAASELAGHGNRELSTRHWVAAVQAQAFAGLGDLDSCNRALDLAGQVHSLAGQVHNGGWLRFDGSRPAEERGTCYTRLGRPDLAEGALVEALDQPLSARRRGSVLTDLAILGIQQKDSDRLLSYAGEALLLAQQSGSGYVGRKLRELQGRLEPFGADRRISALSSQIASLPAIPT